MFSFLLWCILLVMCWPLALLALVLYPMVWPGAIAIPDCGHRRGRSPGTGKRNYFSAGPTFARKSSRLETVA
jgi:hypothetical protein